MFKKGHIAWNKGKPFMQRERNPMWGKHHTYEAKRRISKAHEGIINHYKKYGYDCTIIWSKELKQPEKVIEKIGAMSDNPEHKRGTKQA